MPESSLPTAASGHRPGRPAGDPSAGASAGLPDDGVPSVTTTPPRTATAGDDGSHVIAGLDLFRLTVSVLARAILFAVLGLLVWAVLPLAMGWQTTTVVTNSMVPRIYAGDIIVARPIPTGTAALGQILLVDDPDHAGRLRLHRYVEAASDGGLILRGDANSDNDSSPVTPAAVHGVAVLRVPFAGLPVVWFMEKNWGNLAAVLVGASALLVAAASAPGAPTSPGGSSTPGSAPGQPGTPHESRTRRPGARSTGRTGAPRTRRTSRARTRTRATARAAARKTRTVSALLALAAIPVLASQMITATAHAGFSVSAPTGASSFSALASYPCPVLTTPADSPTFFYRFNESSGLTAENASGAQNASQRYGTLSRATLREPGSCRTNPSPALKLGGSPAGYVSASNGLGAGAVSAPDIFTAEIWFKAPAGSTAGGRLIGFGNAQTGDSVVSDRHLYMTSNGTIAFGAAPNPGNSTNFKATAITSAPGYNDGIWHQATATMYPYGTSTAGMRLYVDGVLVSENAVTAGADISGYWRVGYDALGTNSWPGVSGSPVFAGTVDNAAVYPAALTAGQVAAHFTATKSEIRGS
ncbi:LamG-like jellyroll fold domain-containing protein [Arthrobacter sp. AL12]|uniref:LamG-like jellyroll fold domain-containing protein n=1 Tax=Arthrobacter sp. AL12 TaxID=3042241 RepID=UPI00249AD9C6|nr:LamG-like jellyroll fold domain-containing protein [Arthrobacter sp. AL12]MDI3213857.1 hypothetical protein [Arthrobacter sp. AL12]